MKKIFNLTRFGVVLAMLGCVAGTAIAKAYVLPEIDPANFDTPMDNLYLPMAIGMTYVYEAEEDGELVVNEMTFTTNTIVVMGITNIVIHDVEWVYIEELDEWFITEETDDWQAWDNYGNVWYFGEATVAFEYDDDWNLTGTNTLGSWKAGEDDAEPGILMLADPKPGLFYRQEYYEGEAEDEGRVLRLNARVSVEFGDFDSCLVTKESTPLERGAVEHKFYAPETGLVYIKELSGGKTVHVELVDVVDAY